MTDDIKAKIEADTLTYRRSLERFISDYLLPVLQDIRN